MINSYLSSCIENSIASSKSAKSDLKIDILCFLDGSNRSNFLLKTIIEKTSHNLIILTGKNNIYPSRLINYYQCQERVTVIEDEKNEELNVILKLIAQKKPNLIIFDYFNEDLLEPSISSMLQQISSNLQNKTEILLPFKSASLQKNYSEIFIDLPIDLSNFLEIYQANQELIEEINKKDIYSNYTPIFNLAEIACYKFGNLDAILYYLLSHISSDQCAKFVQYFGDKISRKMLLKIVSNMLPFSSHNESLIDQCLKAAKANSYDINQIIYYKFHQIFHWIEITKEWLDELEFMLSKFSDIITQETKMCLINNTHGSNFFNKKLFDFLVEKIDINPGAALVDMMGYTTILDLENGGLLDRINHIYQTHKNKIPDAYLNLALLAASKAKRDKKIIETLILLGANGEILNNQKNYGWSKLLENSKTPSKEALSWVNENFFSYVEMMNDYLFDSTYGYYGSGIVKIGGQAADFSTNVTNGKGFAFLLASLVAKKWQEAKKPSKFIALELCGGNGKLANDILTIIEIFSKNFSEFEGLFDAVIYRTVDISSGLSKIQQKRNKKFSDLKKFEVILSDASDKKWLEKFEFKNEAGIVFCNELIDQFIPEFSILNQQNQAFRPFSLNYILVNNFDHFYKLFHFEDKFLLDQTKAKKIYSQLKKNSDQHKVNLKKFFDLNTDDEHLLVNKNDFREKIILTILNPRLDKVKELRHKIFYLEEEIEEIKRNDGNNFKHLEVEIAFLLEKLELLKKDINNVWSHFVINHLIIPTTEKLTEFELKYAQDCSLYTSDFKITYHETQLENLLKIIASLKNYEFFVFEYGPLPEEKTTPRLTQYYGFSYLMNEGKALHSGIQKRMLESGICDLYSELFLGVDITIELDFTKIEEIAKNSGLKNIGIYGDQKIADDYLRNSNLEFYKKSLMLLSNYNEFSDLKNDIATMRNFHKSFKVISLKK